MVKIRLTRTGKKHEPHYRIVATDSRTARDGRSIEQIGYYNPRTKPPTLQYDKEILQKWIDNGAQMTDTVFDIFVKEGIVKKSEKREKRIQLMIEESKRKAAEGKEQITKEQKDKEPEAKPEEKPEEKDNKEQEEKPEEKPEEKKPKDDEKKDEEKKSEKEETKPE